MTKSQGATPEQICPPSSPRNNAISWELLWEGKLSKRRQWNLLQFLLSPKGQNGLFRNHTWQRCYSTDEHGWLARQNILQVEPTGGPNACQESQRNRNAMEVPLSTRSLLLPHGADTKGLHGDMD